QNYNSLQLTCSQPFSPCSHFGLSFIQLRKPQGQEPDPLRPPLNTVVASLDPSSHQLCPPARLTFPIPRRAREEKQLRSCLWKLEGAAWSLAHLSRSARMALLAAQNQALRPRAG
ncbi:TRPC2 protein, partial [Prunella himalayana]|nr:TRPC2 protein [Prunella himalayana]